MYLNIYEKIYKIFSPLNPTKLNNINGKQKIIIKNIFIDILLNNKFDIKIIVVIQIILKIPVL